MSNPTNQVGEAFWMPLWAVNAGADVFVRVTEDIRKNADSQKKQVWVVNGKVKRFADAPIGEVYELYKHMRGWLPHKPHLILAFTEIAQERGIDFDAMYENEKRRQRETASVLAACAKSDRQAEKLRSKYGSFVDGFVLLMMSAFAIGVVVVMILGGEP